MAAPTLPDVAKVEIAIVEMTNEFRSKNNLAPVKSETKLTNAARAFATYLARTGKFAHDADGRQPAERTTSAGYQYCFIAENLALNQSSAGFESRDLARQMVEGWINSPGHRRNLLAEHATETAVAIARAPDADPKYIAVQLFARPRALSYEFQISNSSGSTVRYKFGGQGHEVRSGMGVTHSACLPSQLTFEGSIQPVKGGQASGQYLAGDGQVYTLEKAGSGYRVVVSRKERL